MRGRLVPLLALAALALPVLPALATAPSSAAASSGKGFSTSGLWMLDGQGRHLYPRGFDLTGGEDTPTDAPLPYGPADFRAMRATGATVVRLPIAWALIEPTQGKYDQAALARAKQIVQWAGAAGLNVVLDMHQYLWASCFGGNGMPSWAVPNCPAKPPGNPAVQEADEQEAATTFWHSPTLQADFGKAWAAVAKEVGSPSYLLGYDIINEPPPGLTPNEVFDEAYLAPFYTSVGSTLEAINSHALLFLEPSSLDGIVNGSSQFLGPIGLPRVVYEPHQYGATSFNADGLGGVGVVAAGGPTEFAPDLETDRLVAQRMGAALWLGEWGAVEPGYVNHQPLTWLDDDLAEQDQLMLPSAYWSFGSYERGGSLGIGGSMRRIEPAAIAGTPTSIATATTGLTLQYVADGGQTLLSLPSGCRPLVAVSQGKATSAIQSGMLELKAAPGTAVSVAAHCA